MLHHILKWNHYIQMHLHRYTYILSILINRFLFVNLSTHYNLFVTPKSILVMLSWSFTDMHNVVKVFWCTHSQISWTKATLAFLFPLSSHKQESLSWSIYCVFAFLCFLLMILWFKMASSIRRNVSLVFLGTRRLSHVLSKHVC